MSDAEKQIGHMEQEMADLTIECERLKAELAQAKAENARLAAALKTIVKAWPHPLASSAPSPAMYAEQQLRDCSALGDLLAPTIERMTEAREVLAAAMRAIAPHNGCLDRFQAELNHLGINNGFGVRLQQELERLRSLTASGAGDCAGG